MATSKNSYKISAINGRAKGGKKKRNCGHAEEEKRNCGHAEEEKRKKMIDEHLKLLTMPRTILFYKNYKK